MKKRIYLALLLSGLTYLPGFAQDHAANLRWLQKANAAEKNTLILNNDAQLLPVTALEGLSLASVDLNFASAPVFNAMLMNYTKVDTLSCGKWADRYLRLNDQLKLYKTVIFQLSAATVMDKELLHFLQEMEQTKRVIIAAFTEVDNRPFFSQLHSPVIWCRSATPEAASIIAQLIFGGTGKTATRLKYTVPEDAGMNQQQLDSIDIVMKSAITAKAAPGAVIMVIKGGKVIFNKAYGKHTYTGNRAMQTGDIFDMASLTKTSATTLAVMKLVEEGALGLDSTISKYIALIRNMPNKRDIRIREVMLHQAGFFPFIPFYEKLKTADLSTSQSDKFPTEVADNYFLRAGYYKEVMWPEMLNDKVLTRGKYVYSDLSMYYMKEIVEKVMQEKMNTYLDHHFYFPLGMQKAGFLPRKRFPMDMIVPTTENDGWFRKMTVQGFVNDPGAAMAGGVSGHAGLFASANDMGILYQMLLNKGTYGGKKYYEASTVELFTSSQSSVSRRGLGFDRKDPDAAKAYPSLLASDRSFGHTGYTGTMVWVDPACDLVYIFLSNRVYPDDKSRELIRLNIRGQIQDIIYRAIQAGVPQDLN